jgi:hypothetical protein
MGLSLDPQEKLERILEKFILIRNNIINIAFYFIMPPNCSENGSRDHAWNLWHRCSP